MVLPRILPLIFIASLLALTAFPFAQAKEPTYVMGVVPQQSPSKLFSAWQPVTEYLYQQTGLKIHFQTEKSIAEFEDKFKAGTYDFAYMNPYHFVVANQAQGYTAEVRANHDIRGVVVSLGSALTKENLADTVFLFPSPNAFAATLIVKYELLKKFGVQLEQRAQVQYVNSHDSVYKGVERGVGVFGGGVERTLNLHKKSEHDCPLQVVYTTRAYPSHPITFLPSMTKQDREALVKAFLQMPQALLERLNIKAFQATNNAEYAEIKELAKVLAIKD
ncbi:phosphonate transport system substrate-binding protein [uncultured Thiomicrorhabdus sp.]|jgi:phosphonate transport system substrate-binding protein